MKRACFVFTNWAGRFAAFNAAAAYEASRGNHITASAMRARRDYAQNQAKMRFPDRFEESWSDRVAEMTARIPLGETRL